MSEARLLPAWAEDLRRRYLRGEASTFVLHGNVYDVVLCNRKMMALTEFLTDVLLKDSKETIAQVVRHVRTFLGAHQPVAA